MKASEIADVHVLCPVPRHDERGFFTRTFDADVIASLGIDPGSFVQDSQSRSRAGTLRGLHLRLDGRERKLVRCSSGAIFDVVVDLRPGSPTFTRWQSFLLDDERHESLLIPPGCAHGFQVRTERADVCYRMDARYAPPNTTPLCAMTTRESAWSGRRRHRCFPPATRPVTPSRRCSPG